MCLFGLTMFNWADLRKRWELCIGLPSCKHNITKSDTSNCCTPAHYKKGRVTYTETQHSKTWKNKTFKTLYFQSLSSRSSYDNVPRRKCLHMLCKTDPTARFPHQNRECNLGGYQNSQGLCRSICKPQVCQDGFVTTADWHHHLDTPFSAHVLRVR